ncbi:MAG TPA: hypothetical protein IAD07_02975 [Candidatus Fimivicinus intestinavium]|nr:hypothetical protein [Candidatus Fimivicinus intestinavium]
MAHEILSVKLCELEDQLSRLSSRIHLSETAGHERLQKEIKELTKECAETELMLRNKLQMSRADMVSVLSDAYGKIEQLVLKTKDLLQKQTDDSSPDIAAEEKILLAEYALDFSAQAANRALLLSMEAIDAQLLQQERRPQ